MVPLLVNHLALIKAPVCPLPSLPLSVFLTDIVSLPPSFFPQIPLMSLSLSDTKNQHYFLRAALRIILLSTICLTLRQTYKSLQLTPLEANSTRAN